MWFELILIMWQICFILHLWKLFSFTYIHRITGRISDFEEIKIYCIWQMNILFCLFFFYSFLTYHICFYYTTRIFLYVIYFWRCIFGCISYILNKNYSEMRPTNWLFLFRRCIFKIMGGILKFFVTFTC